MVAGYRSILAVAVVLAVLPLVVQSNFVMNFLVMTLMFALLGQGWNVLGGYAGQFSFGHAVFFGTGAYVTAIAQVEFGVNAWAAMVLGAVGGAAVGAFIGFLSFRYGLRGSYFAWSRWPLPKCSGSWPTRRRSPAAVPAS